MIYSEAKSHLLTIRDAVRFATSRFIEAKLSFGHGFSNAYDEAAYLVLSSLHLPHDNLDPFLDARILSAEMNAVLDLIGKRVKHRIPSCYLTKEAWLRDFRFYVDERVIIPRSFIFELLLDRLSPWIDDPDAIESTLDLCTGSGCLAVLMAHVFPNSAVDAADISPDALAVAKINVSDYALDSRISLIHSDLFSSLEGRRYDLIVSNPPYVNGESMQNLPPEYRHEPRLALESGIDGLDATRKILAQAKMHLNPGGWLVVEIGHNIEALEKAFPETQFTWLDTQGGEDHVFLLSREQLPD